MNPLTLASPRLAITAALLMTVALAPAGARGQDVVVVGDQKLTLQSSLDEIAQAVKDKLVARKMGNKKIKIQGFNGTDPEKQVGPMLRLRLSQALIAKKLEPDRDSTLVLEGEFRVGQIPTKEGSKKFFPGVQIDFRLFWTPPGGSRPEELLSSSRENAPSPMIATIPDVLSFTGGNGSIPADSEMNATRKLFKLIDTEGQSPFAELRDNKTTFLPDPDCHLRIQVLAAPGRPDGSVPDQKDYQVRKIEMRNGAPYVTFEAGEVYGVLLVNDWNYRSAVNVTVDGLSMFQFSESDLKQKDPAWVLEPKGNADHKDVAFIRGWHRKEGRTDGNEEEKKDVFNAFRVDEYSRADEANALKDEAKVGQIGLTLRAAWSNPKEVPPDEMGRDLIFADLHRMGDGKASTGVGGELLIGVSRLRVNLGRVRGIVTLHYEK